MAMYREACLDMDNPHQDVQGDALREETRKLQRYMEEQFAQQGKILQELRTQLRFMVRDEAASRLSAYPEMVQAVAGDLDASVAPGVSKDPDECETGPEDVGHNEEEPPAWDPCWDPEMREKLKEHQRQAARNARLTPQLSHNELQAEPGDLVRRFAFHLASSATFQTSIMLLILLNLIMLGIEVDVSSSLKPDEEDPVVFQVLNIVIVIVFIFEIVVKMAGFGCAHFFLGPERWWNCFDLIIISTSVFETFLDILTKTIEASTVDSSHLRIMRFMRLARALRGVRVMRLVRFISALRSIVFAILSTVWSLLWTLVLLVLLFYCFSVILAQLVSDHCRFSTAPCDPSLERHWASVPESMLTLFLSISGGLSWTEALEPLRTVSSVAFSCFIIYIFISTFAILNVVTGVFCNNAIESSKADKDIAIMKQIEWHKGQLRALKGVFHEIDNDRSNKVSITELEVALSEEKLSSFMESMDISTSDVWTLFLILDADGSGEISHEEFVSGCMQLQGPAKSVQLARMRYENKVMRQELRHIGHGLQKLESIVALHYGT